MKTSLKVLSLLLLFLFYSDHSIAQSANGIVSGRVTERNTGQPLTDVRTALVSGGEVVSESKTDEKGEFRLESSSGIYEVLIEQTGFTSVVVNRVEVVGGRITVLNIPVDILLTDSVVIKSDNFAVSPEQPVSNYVLGREDLRSTPGTAGDPLRALNSLPSVTAASGEFADLIVRGGTPDENLTFIDNVPVKDFTYLTDAFDGNRGGRASILAPDVFERAEFSAGGFGPRYGDKLSSVLDIDLRNANRERVQGVLFVDSGTAGGTAEIPLGKQGGWLVSARRSYIDLAFDVAGLSDEAIIGFPRTLDFTNKADYELSSRNKLSISLLIFFETFELGEDEALNIARSSDRFITRRTSQRLIFGTTLTTRINEKSQARTTLWVTGAHNDGTFLRPGLPIRLVQRSRDLRESQVGIKEDISTSPSSRLNLSFGGGLYFDQANFFTFENGGRLFFPLEEEFNSHPRSNRLRLNTTASGYGYFQATFNPLPRLSITPGIRFDSYGITKESLVSPRLGARFSLLPNLSLTFGAGVYRQPPSLFVLSLTPENRSLRSQRASHYISGIEWTPRPDTRIRFEAYHKNYNDLIVRPLRPTENFALDGNYFNSGSGTAKGIEISVQRSLSGRFSGQASYSYTESKRRFTPGGAKLNSDTERPHQLTLIGITRFYGFNIAAKYRLASGLPYTRRTPVDILPPFGVIVQRVVNESDINALRLPSYANLDLRVEKRFVFRRWSFAPYVDIFNVTENKTIVQPNYELFQPQVSFLNEGRRLPIFGLKIAF